jgi:hypothetical protein
MRLKRMLLPGIRLTTQPSFAGFLRRMPVRFECVVHHGDICALYKYNGLNASDTHHLKTLGDEEAQLKHLLAGSLLRNAVLKDLSEKR